MSYESALKKIRLNKKHKNPVLDLINENLNEFPKEIIELDHLQMLRAGENEISDLSLLAQLKNLEILGLSNNKIQDLSPLAKLPKLKSLYLYHNNIVDISALSKLENLDYLSIRVNNIQDISALKDLKNLNTLHLEENPKLEEEIPREILNSSNPRKIIDYFLNIRSAKSEISVEKPRPLNEAKVVVIGEAEAGKTSLIKRLIYGTFDPVESRTHGVRIYTPDQKTPINGHKVQLHFWDFGGQEIMHSTHQFFFTTRTLYVLVLNARQNPEQRQAEQWLQRIEGLGGDAPVLIVGTKLDETATTSQPLGFFDIDREGLKRRFPNIVDIVEVCNDTKKENFNGKFKAFEKKVYEEVGKLKNLHVPFLPEWHKVKEELSLMQEQKISYISDADYKSRCEAAGITSHNAQEDLKKFLHEIGVVSSIDVPTLKNNYVLNPQWLTKGIYALIDNPDVLRADGKLSIENAKALLSQLSEEHPEFQFPDDKLLYLLSVMQQYELCFEIEKENLWLIPAALRQNEIETGDWSNALRFQYTYKIYLRDFILRFIVKMHHLIHKETVWRTGVLLSRGSKNRALVVADPGTRQINIFIDGSAVARREFLAVISHSFDEIHGKNDSANKTRYENIGVTENVPNPTYPEVVRSYQRLRALEDENIPIELIEENGLNVKYSVKEWLDGVADEKTRQLENDRYGFLPQMREAQIAHRQESKPEIISEDGLQSRFDGQTDMLWLFIKLALLAMVLVLLFLTAWKIYENWKEIKEQIEATWLAFSILGTVALAAALYLGFGGYKHLWRLLYQIKTLIKGGLKHMVCWTNGYYFKNGELVKITIDEE